MIMSTSRWKSYFQVINHSITKVNFVVLDGELHVKGNSFLLWVSENYKDLCRAAEELAAKEVRYLARAAVHLYIIQTLILILVIVNINKDNNSLTHSTHRGCSFFKALITIYNYDGKIEIWRKKTSIVTFSYYLDVILKVDKFGLMCQLLWYNWVYKLYTIFKNLKLDYLKK